MIDWLYWWIAIGYANALLWLLVQHTWGANKPPKEAGFLMVAIMVWPFVLAVTAIHWTFRAIKR